MNDPQISDSKIQSMEISGDICTSCFHKMYDKKENIEFFSSNFLVK